MAIIDLVPGLQVEIHMDGALATEFTNPNEQREDRRTVTKYIELRTNQNFEIRITFSPPFTIDFAELACDVFIDRRLARTLVLNRSIFRNLVKREEKIDGTFCMIGARYFSQKFRFGEIKTTTNFSRLSSAREDARALDSVGEILVIFRKAMWLLHTTGNVPQSMLRDLPIREVHEKAQTGSSTKSHAVQFDAPQLVKDNPAYTFLRMMSADGTIAKFRFKYQSLDSLKELSLIDRQPGESALSVLPRSFPRANFTPEQQARIRQFVLDMMDEKVEVKAEVQDEDEKKIKRERESDIETNSARPHKRNRESEVKTDPAKRD